MKIIQLLPELNEGGVERGVVELNRELIKNNIESIVISNGGKLVNQIQKDGGLHIRVNVCSKNPLSVPIRIYKLYKVLKKLHPDILHVRSRVPAWLVFFANKFLHVKVISTVHGFNSIGYYSSIMTKSDRIICVSNSIKKYILKHYQVDTNKIEVVPRGVDLKVFNPKNIDKHFIQEFKNRFLLHDSFIVSSVGRITQLKDLESFIEAIALLVKTMSNVKALIVGGIREDKKTYYKHLKELIRQLNLEEHIIFTDSQSKIAEIYALSHVVVSSSKKPESFGRSVAESIALNTPVVATNHGGVKDIIQNGKNGFLIPLQNPQALKEAILQANSLEFDGQKYIQENFSLDAMVEKTLRIYKQEAKKHLILMYHSVDDVPLKRLKGLRVDVATFEKQMDYLKKTGFESFTLAQMVEKKDNLPLKSVAITFDDGYRDNFTNALPILKKYNFKATVFLIVNRHDNDWSVHRKVKNRGIVDKIPKLNDKEVQDMIKSKIIEIGAHTLFHKNFSKMTLEEKKQEIIASKKQIEQTFCINCRSFSYPFGIYAENDDNLVRKAGFLCAVTTKKRAVNFEKDNLFLLPRVAIKNNFSSFKKRIHQA